MGRPKGSKNKATKAKDKPVKAPEAAIEAPKSVYVPLTPVAMGEKEKYVQRLRTDGLELCKYHGMAEWPDDIMAGFVLSILNAPDKETTERAFAKATDRLQVHLWAQWAVGKITGPITALNVEVRAQKAESLAKYLDSMGDTEGADKQYQRAERIRDSLEPDAQPNDAVQESSVRYSLTSDEPIEENVDP